MTDITQTRSNIDLPRFAARQHDYCIQLLTQGRIRVFNNAKIAADLQNGFTFLIWCDPDYAASSNLINQRIIGYSGSGTHQRFIELFIVGASNQTTLFGRIANNSTSQEITSTQSIGSERCLIGMRYEAGVDLSIVLNDSFVGNAVPTISPVHNGEHLYLGALQPFSSFFTGRIGRVLIYQRAITLDELQNYYYNDIQPSGSKNLELLMREGSGNPVDTSGNSLNVTLQGSTAWASGFFSSRG